MEFIRVVIYLSIYIGLVAISFYILSYVSDKKKPRKFFSDDELPRVSVIIPAYNEEESIERTLESILNSNYPKDKLEVIVVDDGSIDETFNKAKKFEKKGVKVFHKENHGKASALNYGLKKVKGEIIFTMDADTFVEPHSLKNMVRYFKDERVMSVTPAIVTYNPRTLWQRVQQMEYIFGIFLRKVFAALDAIYVTPGAFSAYRAKFFKKYGGFDEKNITEDLEMSLRIQYHGYKIENSLDSPVYTLSPPTFAGLLKQRRRWYVGLMRNVWKYRKIISKKYGDLGVFVMPLAWICIFFSVFITSYIIIRTLLKVVDEISFLSKIDYQFWNLFHLNSYILERFFFLLFTDPVFLFVLISISLLLVYVWFAKKRVKRINQLAINLPLYFIFFALLFGFWWIVSIIYALLRKDIKWK